MSESDDVNVLVKVIVTIIAFIIGAGVGTLFIPFAGTILGGVIFAGIVWTKWDRIF